MSFRQIGELCRDVIAEAELRSRAPSTAAKGGRLTPGGQHQPALPSEEVAPAKLNKKDGRRAPASQGRDGQARRGKNEAAPRKVSPAYLRLVSNSCEPTRNAALSVYPPTRRVGSHLVLVVDNVSDHLISPMTETRAKLLLAAFGLNSATVSASDMSG